MADDIDTTIENAAKNPKRAKGDSSEIEQFDLSDLIAAAKYLKGQSGIDKKYRGLRINKMIASGPE